MKALIAICTLLAATFAWAGDTAAPAAPGNVILNGEVLEVKDVESYTYLRLKTSNGETWAAVAKAVVKTGDTVAIENPMVMTNFTSKALNRTFPTILFGTLANAGAGTGAGAGMGAGTGATGGHALGTAYATLPGKKLESINMDVHVDKASGANARTVAEIYAKAAELKGKTIVLRGKVVKYNPDIMGKNWIHLRDGTGMAADGSNDILVTSKGQTGIGSVVTVKGVVNTDKDFGAGYAYKVLIENATLK